VVDLIGQGSWGLVIMRPVIEWPCVPRDVIGEGDDEAVDEDAGHSRIGGHYVLLMLSIFQLGKKRADVNGFRCY